MTREEVIDAMYNEYMRIRSLTSKAKSNKDAFENISKPGGAADMCIAIDADPVLYVKALDKYKSGNVFFPNMLLNKNATSIYQKFVTSYNEVHDNTFTVQLTYLLSAIKGGRTIESVLMDDHLQLEPWFRVVISKEPIKEVIKKYAAKAKEQLTGTIKTIITSKKLDIDRIYEPGRYN